MEYQELKLVEFKSKHDAEVRKLHAKILDATLKPLSLDDIFILELFDKWESPLETMGSNNSLEEQVNSPKSVIKRLHVDK